MHHVIALQFLDGDKELLACGGVKVVVVAIDLAVHLLAHDIAVLIEQCAFVALSRGDDELGEVAPFVVGEVLTAAVVALDALAQAMRAIDGREVDRAVLALALLDGESQHLVIFIGVVGDRLDTLAALDGGLREQALFVENEHIVALAAVGHHHLLVDTARTAVKAQIQMLDAVTVRWVVHQVGVEQLHMRVNRAHRVDIGRQGIECDLLVTDNVLSAHRPYRQAGHHGQPQKSPFHNISFCLYS